MTESEIFAVMIDGQVVAQDQARISVFDRGFLYGDSIYEVMRTYDGKIFALREHIDRLFRSAEQVFIDIPVSKDRLSQEILHAASLLELPNLLIRVHITRGIGPYGLDPTGARQPTRVMIVVPLLVPSEDQYRDGIAAALFQSQRTTDNTSAAGAKVANYLVSLLALRQAHAVGAKEAIIVDGRGRVLEGASSNVFIVRSGVIRTPPVNEGILSGITRSYLLKAAAHEGLDLRETSLTQTELLDADEVFVSSTTREVLPVTRIDDRTIGTGKVGPITRAIHRAFRVIGGLPATLPGDRPNSTQ